METAINKVTTWYNSHGRAVTFAEFIETEVEDRQNYTIQEIHNWRKKYNIQSWEECIWVTANKWIANSYNLLASEYERRYNYKEQELEFVEIPATAGFIIPESEDGDEGFLLIYRTAQATT